MGRGVRLSDNDAARIVVLISLLLFTRGQALAAEQERSFIDGLGQRVKIKRDVKKIVSLVPANSEMVCLLDCARLKGGTRYDRFPEELVKRVREQEIQIVGGGFDPNLEKIVEIGPDLILTDGPSQQRVVLPLKRMGYTVLSLNPRDIEAIQKDFLLLGEILGEKTKAEKIVKGVERGLEDSQKRTRDRNRKKVYIQTWSDPMITVGKGSFSHWLITLAGGINVFGDVPFDSTKVSVESVIQRNPEVLIFLNQQEKFVERVLRLRPWKQIDGVKKNHICLIDGDYFRKTIQFIDGVEKIYECLFGTAS